MDVKHTPNGSVKNVRHAAVGAGAGAVTVVTSYEECLKNHAACMGAHALDGCGGYLPSLELNPADPATFTCVACSCHRNFHRRVMVEVESPPRPAQPQVALLPAQPMVASILDGLPQRGEATPEDRLPAVDGDDCESDSDGCECEYDNESSVSPPQLQQAPPAHLSAPVAQQPPAYFTPAPQPQPNMLLNVNSSAPTVEAQSQRLPVQVSPAMAPPVHVDAPARKRFRTNFTAEQKQRMQELSERLGWRLQNHDGATVDEWSRYIGVSKGVFKVWMHNNKRNYMGGHSARGSASATAFLSVATTPTAPAAAGPFHISPAPGTPPPFIPSVTHSSPAPTATGFNVNGTATSAVTPTPTFTASTK